MPPTDPQTPTAREPGSSSRRFGLRLAPLVLAALGVALLLRYLQPASHVLLLLLAAGAVAAALQPLADRLPWRRTLSGALTAAAFWIVAAGLLVLLGWLFQRPLREQLVEWHAMRQGFDANLAQLSRHLSIRPPLTARRLLHSAGTWLLGNGAGMLAEAANRVVAVVVSLLLVVFGSVFLLAGEPGRLSRPLARLLPVDDRTPLLAAFSELPGKLRGWLLGAGASIAIVWLLTWPAFVLVGLRFAFPLALLAGASEIVPTLGPSLAFLVALLFASTQGHSVVLGVLVAWTIVQLTESHVLLPLVMRRAVRLPPLVTLFTVILWAELFGLLGLVLAIPLDLVVWTFAEKFLADREHRSTATTGRES